MLGSFEHDQITQVVKSYLDSTLAHLESFLGKILICKIITEVVKMVLCLTLAHPEKFEKLLS